MKGRLQTSESAVKERDEKISSYKKQVIFHMLKEQLPVASSKEMGIRALSA